MDCRCWRSKVGPLAVITISLRPAANSCPNSLRKALCCGCRSRVVVICSPSGLLCCNSVSTSCRKSLRAITSPFSVSVAVISKRSPTSTLFGSSLICSCRSVTTITRLSGSKRASINQSPAIGCSIVIRS